MIVGLRLTRMMLLRSGSVEYGTVGRLGGVLRTMLLKYLPDNVAELASGRVTIGMTDFGGFQRLPFNAVLVNQFHSKVCCLCSAP